MPLYFVQTKDKSCSSARKERAPSYIDHVFIILFSVALQPFSQYIAFNVAKTDSPVLFLQKLGHLKQHFHVITVNVAVTLISSPHDEYFCFTITSSKTKPR